MSAVMDLSVCEKEKDFCGCPLLHMLKWIKICSWVESQIFFNAINVVFWLVDWIWNQNQRRVGTVPVPYSLSLLLNLSVYDSLSLFLSFFQFSPLLCKLVIEREHSLLDSSLFSQNTPLSYLVLSLSFSFLYKFPHLHCHCDLERRGDALTWNFLHASPISSLLSTNIYRDSLTRPMGSGRL